MDKLNYSDFDKIDVRNIKVGQYFFESLFSYPFNQLENKTFSEIDINQFTKWNDIDFTKMD